MNHDGGRTWQTMQNVFAELNYFITPPQILDARDFGIPQGRRRLFVIGFKDEKLCEKFSYPKKQELKYTVQDFIFDNCAFGNFTNDANGNLVIKRSHQEPSEKLFLSEKLVKYIMSPGTKNFYHPNDTVTDLPIARAILSTQGNTHRASVNNYISYPDENAKNQWKRKFRALDPRESLRLMGFTDDFISPVSKAQSYKQSGNSIVVDVFIAILRNLLPLLEVE